jgi:hypothetical protein
MGALKTGQERSVELASHEVKSLQRQLQDLETTLADCGPVHDKEVARLEKRNARELQVRSSAQARRGGAQTRRRPSNSFSKSPRTWRNASGWSSSARTTS